MKKKLILLASIALFSALNVNAQNQRSNTAGQLDNGVSGRKPATTSTAQPTPKPQQNSSSTSVGQQTKVPDRAVNDRRHPSVNDGGLKGSDRR